MGVFVVFSSFSEFAYFSFLLSRSFKWILNLKNVLKFLALRQVYVSLCWYYVAVFCFSVSLICRGVNLIKHWNLVGIFRYIPYYMYIFYAQILKLCFLIQHFELHILTCQDSICLRNGCFSDTFYANIVIFHIWNSSGSKHPSIHPSIKLVVKRLKLFFYKRVGSAACAAQGISCRISLKCICYSLNSFSSTSFNAISLKFTRIHIHRYFKSPSSSKPGWSGSQWFKSGFEYIFPSLLS